MTDLSDRLGKPIEEIYENISDYELLARTLYGEAGTIDKDGVEKTKICMIAVAFNIINRVVSKDHPDSIRDVLFAGVYRGAYSNTIVDKWPTIEPMLMSLVDVLAQGLEDAVPILLDLGETLLPIFVDGLRTVFQVLKPLISVSRRVYHE